MACKKKSKIIKLDSIISDDDLANTHGISEKSTCGTIGTKRNPGPAPGRDAPQVLPSLSDTEVDLILGELLKEAKARKAQKTSVGVAVDTSSHKEAKLSYKDKLLEQSPPRFWSMGNAELRVHGESHLDRLSSRLWALELEESHRSDLMRYCEEVRCVILAMAERIDDDTRTFRNLRAQHVDMMARLGALTRGTEDKDREIDALQRELTFARKCSSKSKRERSAPEGTLPEGRPQGTPASKLDRTLRRPSPKRSVSGVVSSGGMTVDPMENRTESVLPLSGGTVDVSLPRWSS